MNGIVIKTNIYGIHQWNGVVKDQELENVHFLQHPHMHNFHVTCKRKVTHSDRDVEIIDFKTQIDRYLYDVYFDVDKGYCVFGQTSCEMLANELAVQFDLCYCEVLEDGNFGGFYESC